MQWWILSQFSWKHLNSYVFRERQMNALSHFQWKYAWHYLNVTGNLTHFTKLKLPLYSSFQHNFRNNIQLRHYWEEKWDYCQTKASKRNELEISIQRLEAKRKITFYETVGCKNCLLIRRNKYIHSVQSRAHTCEKFPREHAPEPP